LSPAAAATEALRGGDASARQAIARAKMSQIDRAFFTVFIMTRDAAPPFRERIPCARPPQTFSFQHSIISILRMITTDGTPTVTMRYVRRLSSIFYDSLRYLSFIESQTAQSLSPKVFPAISSYTDADIADESHSGVRLVFATDLGSSLQFFTTEGPTVSSIHCSVAAIAYVTIPHCM
jgi:hypothetical protein